MKTKVVLVLLAIVILCVGCKGGSKSTEGEKPTAPSENQFDAKVLEVEMRFRS